MEAPATIGDFFRVLYEMGFNEAQVQSAVQAGVFSVQEATEWLLQGGEQRQRLYRTSSESSGAGAIAAFNPPRLQELPLSPGTSTTDSSSQESLGSPSPSSRMKLDKKEFEELQRDKIAQEVKAEKRNKKKDHEMVLKRIADDRKMLQEKMQVSPKADTSPQKGQRLGGTIQTTVDNYCLLMIRLPSGDSLRERFSADAPLQCVVDHVSRLHPHLQSFDLLQTFPKRNFSQAERDCTLKELGLTPNATLCIRVTEQKLEEDSSMVLGHTPPNTNPTKETQEVRPAHQPEEPRPHVLPMDEQYLWGRGESLGLRNEDMSLENLMREGNVHMPLLSSPAHRVTPGSPGIHGLWEGPSGRHHRWGRGQKLVPEGEEEEVGEEPADEDHEDEAEEEEDDDDDGDNDNLSFPLCCLLKNMFSDFKDTHLKLFFPHSENGKNIFAAAVDTL